MAKKSDLTRRDFLEVTAATSLGALAPACSSDGGSKGGGSGGAGGSGGSGDAGGPDVTIPPGKAAVAVTAHADVEAAVLTAIELSGGLDEIKPGDSVFIKPNAVHPAAVAPAIVTSPEVLAAVIRAVRARGAGHIVVGDRSARSFESQLVFDQTGLGQAALDAGADEIYAAPKPMDAPDDWVLVQPERWDEWWDSVGGILAMKRMLDADHLINVPVCKNHRWAVFSLTLKAFIGAIGDASRDHMHYTAADPNNLSRAIAIMNQIYSPLLNVIDATGALVNGGPEGVGTDAVRTAPGLIIASRDRVASDVVGAAVLRHEITKTTVPMPDVMHARLASERPWAHAQIVHGIERGLGISSADDLLLRFDGVAPAHASAIEALVRA